MPDIARQLDVFESAVRQWSGPCTERRHLDDALETMRAIAALVDCPVKATIDERARRLAEVLRRIGITPAQFQESATAWIFEEELKKK